MWTSKQTQTDLPGTSRAQGPGTSVNPANATPTMRSGSPTVRDVARLGAGLVVKGEISGDEDLVIDGTVQGTVTIQSHRLTVGSTAQLSSDVVAREVVIYGEVSGNLRVRERVEIKKDSTVIGDITTARISIEDGAYFKGRIEIDRGNRPMAEDLDSVGVPVATGRDLSI
jgi:cytoskeletal protein CcmA (bactofilin family)